MPGRLVTYKTRAKLTDSVWDHRLEDVSLHHLVRDGDSPAAIYIRQIDERLRQLMRARNRNGNNENDEPEPLTDEELKKYQDAVSEREKEVLGQADIILCTCTGSGAYRVRDNTNIQQLIIDECAMCKELESLIPIVFSRPQQVVLVGDHKQLQPIILEKSARKCGLGRSLFERYARPHAIMLTIQYRMHKGIMAFPSEQFYENRLEIGKQAQAIPSRLQFWPSGGDRPIAFLHVNGLEQTLTVATEEGSEQSKSNLQEVRLAGFIVRSLVLRYTIQQKDIAVLSQYRAQSSQITECLRVDFPDVSVSTVVAAQGSEWDYVILSTVRSLPVEDIDPHPSLRWKGKHLGFITDDHQINVAITRARKGLIIIGNKHLLACDEMWKKLLEHYERHGKIVDGSEFML
jgi:superfamily I DNA and/or RNA helicase